MIIGAAAGSEETVDSGSSEGDNDDEGEIVGGVDDNE